MWVPLFCGQHRLHRWTSRALLLPGEDELGDILEGHGFASVRTKNFGPYPVGAGQTRVTLRR